MEAENQRADAAAAEGKGGQSVAQLDAALSVLQQEVVELKESHKNECALLQTDLNERISELDSAEQSIEEAERENHQLRRDLEAERENHRLRRGLKGLIGPTATRQESRARGVLIALRAGALAAKHERVRMGSAAVMQEKARLEEAAAILTEELRLVSQEKRAQEQQQLQIQHQHKAGEQAKVAAILKPKPWPLKHTLSHNPASEGGACEVEDSA